MLAYLVCGCTPGTAPFLIATHGVTDCAASLVDLGARLGDRFTVIAVDLPSHGLSPRLASDDDPLPTCARALLETTRLLTAEHPGIPIVGYGHSMGGATITAAALQAPTAFAALVLEDPAWLTVSQRRAYQDAAYSTCEMVTAYRRSPDQALARIKADYPSWPLVELGGWLAGKYQVSLDFLARGIVGVTVEDDAALAASIIPPTCLITGTKDDVIIGLQRAKTLAAEGLDVTVIDGASHTVRRDRTDAFHAALDTFLERTPL